MVLASGLARVAGERAVRAVSTLWRLTPGSSGEFAFARHGAGEQEACDIGAGRAQSQAEFEKIIDAQLSFAEYHTAP